MNINYTLVASLIAAGASITTALITLFSKNKDFKNDYYKRVIDKRLKAYEEIELILFSLRRTALVRRSIEGIDEEVGSIFMSEQAFDAFTDSIQEVIKKGIWLSTQSREELIRLNNEILTIKVSIKPDYDNKLFDVNKLIEAGIQNSASIESFRVNITEMMISEIIDMQNVEKFFEQISQLVDKHQSNHR
jgi:hypothetical protein